MGLQKFWVDLNGDQSYSLGSWMLINSADKWQSIYTRVKSVAVGLSESELFDNSKDNKQLQNGA